jgi:hypothetical protein
LLNFSELGWEQKNLNHLDLPFIEEEVLTVIKGALRDNAPGPDEFIGVFFASFGGTIKGDIVQAIHHFYLLN